MNVRSPGKHLFALYLSWKNPGNIRDKTNRTSRPFPKWWSLKTRDYYSPGNVLVNCTKGPEQLWVCFKKWWADNSHSWVPLFGARHWLLGHVCLAWPGLACTRSIWLQNRLHRNYPHSFIHQCPYKPKRLKILDRKGTSSSNCICLSECSFHPLP